MFAVFLTFFISTAVSPYYTSPSKLSFFDASQFCLQHCQSGIASIHSEQDYHTALSQSRNISYLRTSAAANDDIWFGLTNYYTGEYEYSDFTAFNYGNTSIYTSYPWDTSITPATAPGAVKINHNNLWEHDDVSSLHRFMCNSCDPAVNKYMVRHVPSSWSDALAYCRNEVGTDLASFHSARDVEEGYALCQFAPCWIGLNDIDAEGEYEWSDQSAFLYGYDERGGVEPWDELQPNSSSAANCVSLHQYNGNSYTRDLSSLWRVSNCESMKSVLCAMPNELCAFKANSWSILQGQWEPIACANISLAEDTFAVITDKSWSSDLLVIEWMILLQGTSEDDNAAGVMIFNSAASICDYYSVSVSWTQSKQTLKISKFVDNVETLLSTKSITVGLFVWTSIRIEIESGNIFTVYLNTNGQNLVQISAFTDGNESPLNADVRIGVKTKNIALVVKSLYVSGTIFMLDDSIKSDVEAQCAPVTFVPTRSPTRAPTLEGETRAPTKPPTDSPTNTIVSVDSTHAGSTAATSLPVPTVWATEGQTTKQAKLYDYDVYIWVSGGVAGMCLCGSAFAFVIFLVRKRHRNNVPGVGIHARAYQHQNVEIGARAYQPGAQADDANHENNELLSEGEGDRSSVHPSLPESEGCSSDNHDIDIDSSDDDEDNEQMYVAQKPQHTATTNTHDVCNTMYM